MNENRDRPPAEVISKTLLNSVGIKVKKTLTGIKFVYKEETVRELEQLGFSINVLKVRGGEVPLPVLHDHVDEQAALEAYWSAQAEKARYQLSVGEDEFDYWYSARYAECFGILQDMGVPKPTQKEVEAKIARKYRFKLTKKKEHIRKLEYRYRMLCNACYASVVTKGKMLQTLRNIIQGSGTTRLSSVENEVIGTGDVSNMRVEGGRDRGRR